jgi:hypothetical protein
MVDMPEEGVMDEGRMTALVEKASTVGLSESEATELGRLYAEAAGKEHSTAADESAARAGRTSTYRIRDERKERRRRWPLRYLDRRMQSKGRSLEIGATATPPEDADRAA